MLVGEQMYIASGILFILSCLLLLFAWKGLFQAESVRKLPRWRRVLIHTTLPIAVASTILNIVWNVSWLHSGGSPHGMGAGPGIWQSLGPFLVWTFVAATILSVFAIGKSRILMFCWSVSMFFVFQMIYILQFD